MPFSQAKRLDEIGLMMVLSQTMPKRMRMEWVCGRSTPVKVKEWDYLAEFLA